MKEGRLVLTDSNNTVVVEKKDKVMFVDIAGEPSAFKQDLKALIAYITNKALKSKGFRTKNVSKTIKGKKVTKKIANKIMNKYNNRLKKTLTVVS